MSSLFPALITGSDHPALRFGERSLTHAELAAVAGALACRLRGTGRVAVWATPTLESAVGVVAALLAGVPAVPLNPRTGARELEHIVSDSAPTRVLAAPGDVLPPVLAALDRTDVDVSAAPGPGEPLALSGPVALPAAPSPEAPALVVYTSGTTGPPKGAVLPRRAITATLDALADAWR